MVFPDANVMFNRVEDEIAGRMAGLFSPSFLSLTTSLTLFLEITLPHGSREKLITFFSQLIFHHVTELMKFDPWSHNQA